MFSNNHQVPRGAKAVHLTNQPKHYLRDSNITYITQTFLLLYIVMHLPSAFYKRKKWDGLIDIL